MAAMDQLQLFVGAKNKKLSQKLFKFQSHSPPYGDVQVIFKGFTEI